LGFFGLALLCLAKFVKVDEVAHVSPDQFAAEELGIGNLTDELLHDLCNAAGSGCKDDRMQGHAVRKTNEGPGC